MKLIQFIILFAAALGQAEEADPEQGRHWPFTPLGQVTPPVVTQTNWVSNPVDAFILAKLEAKGIAPAPLAKRRALVRRLYFDLLGVPPGPDAADAFVNDRGPLAYGRLVDRLLNDPRYGERWGRYWLDLARYADTAGYEGDPDMPHAWRYRDYVIDSLNRDKPYDLFIREQIAGDEFNEIMGAGELPGMDAERTVALTFLRLAPFTEPRGDETRHELLSEMTSTVSSVFLGLTIGCAQCHDHKYDAIPIDDFYRMQAFFSTVQIPPPERGDGFQIGGPLPAGFYRPHEQAWVDATRAGMQREVGEAKQQLAKLTKQLESRIGKSNAGAGNRKLRDTIYDRANDLFTKHERDLFYRLENRERFVKQHLKRLKPAAMSLRHSFGPPYEPGVPVTTVKLRGEHDNPGPVVKAGFPSLLTGHSKPASIRLDPFKRWPTRSRRMALAKWIASADNPLTARVMMNRLWHGHFGRGIVKTPSDFGKLSGGATHPRLLDWLAKRFVDSGWSLKAMHRLLVTSSTYRQSSLVRNEAGESVDPVNDLWWHYEQRRLDAEAIRDSVLAVSGRLNPELYGLPIFPPLPGDIAETVKYNENKWDTQLDHAGRKRSIYIYQQRTLNMPFMQAFDSTVCDESRPRRRTSVTPLQALSLFNGDFVNEEAAALAGRIRREAGEGKGEQVRLAYRLVFSRSPSPEEAGHFVEFLGQAEEGGDALVGFCRVLLNANEFVYID